MEKNVSCFFGCITLMGSGICTFYLCFANLKNSNVVLHLHPRGSKCQSTFVFSFLFVISYTASIKDWNLMSDLSDFTMAQHLHYAFFFDQFH